MISTKLRQTLTMLIGLCIFTVTAHAASPSPKVASKNTTETKKSSPYHLAFFNPNYVLPFYYTQSPYESVYRGNTPDNQRVESDEFKAQLSFQFPLWYHLFGTKTSLIAAYTQLMYWQFYSKSQYFREINYEPELFFDTPLSKDWSVHTGIVHQSNGRGGSLERSWNRAYADFIYQTPHWYVSLKPWLLIFKAESTDLHNPHIRRYLGDGRVVVAYKVHNVVLSLMLRNELESGFHRGAEAVTLSVPMVHKIRAFVQVFSGYGQSLIEYDHYTNAIGIGISFNDWLVK